MTPERTPEKDKDSPPSGRENGTAAEGTKRDKKEKANTHPNPFMPNYGMKQDEARVIHVPREPGIKDLLKPIASRAMNGERHVLVIVPPVGGMGTTHFIEKEVIPALEELGCVPVRADASMNEEDCVNVNVPRSECTPELLWKIAMGNNTPNSLPEHARKWLPRDMKDAHRMRAWRDECKIGELALPPYQPKIYAHSLERKPESEEQENEDDGHWHHRLRRERRPGNAFLQPFAKLASMNRKALAVVADMSTCGIMGGKRGEEAGAMIGHRFFFWGERFRATLLVLCLDGPSPDFVRGARKYGATIAKLSRPKPGFVRDVLAAHQKASGRTWFTEEALDIIAEKYRNQVGKAMVACYEIAMECGGKGPIGAETARTMMKRCWHEGKNVGIRFG